MGCGQWDLLINAALGWEEGRGKHSLKSNPPFCTLFITFLGDTSLPPCFLLQIENMFIIQREVGCPTAELGSPRHKCFYSHPLPSDKEGNITATSTFPSSQVQHWGGWCCRAAQNSFAKETSYPSLHSDCGV